MIDVGLILFPGSNCERETALALKRAGMKPVEFLWNEPLEKLKKFSAYVLVGGFSYEDRSRSGIIAALDPVMDEIKAQSEQGKPVLGICNGAQILVEAGFFPSLGENHTHLALTENKRIAQGKIIGLGFYNAWVSIRLTDNYQHNAFTRYLTTQDRLHLPVAHAEGRFIMSDDMYEQLKNEGLNLFQYCDEDGSVVNDFPVNPNGSIGNIAAISNRAGNVMAMMPHPERTPGGDALFHSMRDYISEGHLQKKTYYPLNDAYIKPILFKKDDGCNEVISKLIINDNQALTVEKTLRSRGFSISVQRYVHWELDCDNADTLSQIKNSGVLFCERKEHEVNKTEINSKKTLSYLVRSKENIIGQKTLQILENDFHVVNIKKLKQGVLWQFLSNEADIKDVIDDILRTNIIRNPYAHECYEYN